MRVFVALVVLCVFGLAYSVQDEEGPKREQTKNMRGFKYCEILVSNSAQGFWHILDLTAFNTLMFGCDEKKWNALTDQKVASQFGNAAMVKLNGPRYWTIDTVSANSSLIDPKLTYIGDIKMIVVGIVKASYYDIFMKLVFGKVTNYIERHVNRHTVYVFRAGELAYIMTSPLGKTYIMQSMSAQYDTSLTMEGLKDLGSKLKPPLGWFYKVVKLKEDLYVPAPNSIGTLINDEFFNSYSLFDSSLLDGKVSDEL